MVRLPDTPDEKDSMNMDTSNLWSLLENIENEFYNDNASSSLQDDIWKKFDLESMPTPPSSPIYDSHALDRDIDSILNKTLNFSHSLDDTLSQTFTVLPNLSLDSDLDTQLQNSLIKDCMWSAPGLIAAGFLPGDSVGSPNGNSCKNSSNKQVKQSLDSSSTLDENCNTILTGGTGSCKKLNLDINTKDCVDPAAVFPCPTTTSTTSLCLSRNGSPNPSSSIAFHGYDLGMDTPSASSESDEEEIDVVTVAEKKQRAMSNRSVRRPATLTLNNTKSHHHHQQTTTPQSHISSSQPLSTTLPATTSVSAQVAAMHNYSSTTSHPRSLSSRDYHHSKSSYSAPQTPSSGHHHHSSSSHKRSRPYSSPNSPQYSKKQKLIAGESDLKAVARKLTGRRTNHHHSRVSHHNTSSSNSSDMEDNSELGKRAYHNVLERRRRDDLRASFHQLRDKVPEICSNEKAPKMVILNKAMDHIRGLNRTQKLLVAEFERQKEKNEQLKRKLSMLNNCE